MNTRDLIVQQPAKPSRLVLLYRGAGSRARDLAPLGEALAPHRPDAAIVNVQAPEASGNCWQWFSVPAITETNRPARAAAAMPGFVQSVRLRQQARGVEAAATTLISFSQGAILPLESTQLGSPRDRDVGPFRAAAACRPRIRAQALAAWRHRCRDACARGPSTRWPSCETWAPAPDSIACRAWGMGWTGVCSTPSSAG